MKGFIYKITNQVNEKIYVGQTKHSLQRRFREHKQSAKCKKERELFDSFYEDITKKEPTTRDIYEANLMNGFSEIDFWINY